MNKTSIVPPLRFVFLMWLFFAVEQTFGLDLRHLGVLPRTMDGTIGIVTAPLVHGSIWHIISNTFPMLVLGTVLYVFYSSIATQVFLQCYVFSGILIWLFGRPLYHIGASGLAYGLAAFLMAMGFFRRDVKSILITVVIIFMYGGLVYGILPLTKGVSWEGHLFGAAVGVISAWMLRKQK